MKNYNLIKRLFMDSHEKQSPQRFARYAAMLIMLLTLGVGQMWGAAKQRYVYVGISKTLNDNIVANQWGFNVWGGTSAGVKSCTYITDITHDGRNYKVFRAYVYDDNNMAQFKPKDGWWEPGSGVSVKLNGTNNNAVFFSHGDDGWSGQFQRDFQVESTASLAATRTQMTTAQTSTLTPSLSSNADYNDIKSTSYEVTTNPGGGGSVNASGVFSATKVGTYVVTATVTYNAKDFTGITKTATATQTITVMGTPEVSLTVDKVNVNQITLTGTITNYNNSGSNASDLSEVGFYIGATKYTATYTSGNTFKKTITGLTANTAYANVKAFATNALSATGYSSTTTVTTLADATYRVKVRVAHNATAPKIYAWTDADGYGGEGMSNGTYGSQSAISKLATGTTYDWYYCDLNNCYEKFLIYTTGDANKTDDIAATRTSDCFWYNASAASQGSRKDKMDCPIFEPNVYIETSAGSGSYTYEEMSTSPSISKTLTLSAKSTYKFKILYNAEYYGKASTNITRASNSASSMAVDGDYINLKTDAAGDYTFTYTPGTKTVTVTYPTAYTVTFGKGTGGNTIGATATSAGGALTSGNYVASGDNVTFTQTANTGYTFVGWYNASTGGSAVPGMSTIDNVLDAISANATVYSRYTENMTSVTITANNKAAGSVTVGGADFEWDGTTTAGVATTRALVVTAAPGYYFSGWTRSDGADFHLSGYGEANTSVTLTGDGAGETSGQTLTANFTELEKIYFRDVFDDGSTVTHWGDVYVYLGITWNGSNQAVTNSSHDDWRIHMTQIKGTNVWWAYVPRNFTTASAGTKEKVGFAKTNQNGRSYTFHNTKAATRGDYNKALNMFVPYHTAKTTGNNGVDYFDNGYWMKYDTRANNGAGYYLKRFNSKNNYTQEGEFIATSDDATFIQFDLRIDAANSTLKYMISSAGNLNYVSDAAVTSSNCTNVGVSENLDKLSEKEVYFSLTTTSEGIYSFVLDQSGDKMKLNVIYPVSVGDYRLKHTYNDGSAKTTYSDIIKSSGASTPRTLSMYLSTAGSETLVLQKCTLITAGVAQWTAGDATNLGGVLTTVGDNYGVYQFDVAVSADKVASAPTATKYTGPYYIKTNGATGGWANYKQNFMDENTINYDTDHPENSFNYYYCKYYKDAGTNLKCVIANDYCNALTDTLIGDAVIGMGNQTTPSAASVRFSYNTYTNEIKRAYLGATLAADFLLIRGAATDGASHIYTSGGTRKASIKFEDKQNWRYEIDIKADVNARAKLTAGFNGQTQYFMGAAGTSGHEWDEENTEQLFGGAEGTYGLTLVYDFKTNKLIRAWRPTGDAVNADLTLKSDVLLLREHQGAPTAITFGLKDESNYASLKEVKTVYSVLRFNRWKLGNRANPTDVDPEHCNSTANINTYHKALNPGDAGYLSDHERELYFISFPYDVKMSDIIHFGGYYDKWGIMYYDGKGRAKNGYWIDSEPNWKYFTPEEFATKTLNAYEGYLIGIDLAQMGYSNTSFWTNNSSEVNIYFPSKEAVSTITQHAVTVNIDTTGYKCTINRDFGGNDGDRRIKDSHWHCIGVPSYANLSHAINNGEPDDEDWTNKELLYLYEWNTETNDHSIKEAASFSFQAMYAYLVQYAGTTLSWTAAAATGPVPIAARHIKTEELRDRQFNLYLLQGDKEADHTYIRLSDDEEVTSGFEFNHDVSKMMLNGANIYTLIDKEQAAANSLPLNMEQTTVVPVGVKIAADGEYTFSIPEGTEGIGVVLIDKLTGARTNLALTDYEVSLTVGKIEDRFSLEISPIKNTPTGIDNTDAQNSNVRKVMVDGTLYIIKDGKVFDAQGRQVK